jgi:hypothetical protein
MNNPYWHEDLKPHVIDFGEVRSLCFRAYSVLGASRSLMGLPGDEIGGPLVELFFARAEPELNGLLLNLALKMRTFEDILTMAERKAEYEEFLAQQFEAGEFGSIGWEGEGMPDRIDLTFREACNKIIHGLDIRAVYDNGSNDRTENWTWGMTGTIEINGLLRGKQWDAWLAVDEFLNGCLSISDHFEAK